MSKDKERAEKLYKKILQIMRAKVGDSTTYLSTLQNAGNKLFGNKFLGVFASDQLPLEIKKKQLCIANLDKSWQSGSHWIALGRDKSSNILYVYDSFGRNIYQIMPSLKRYTNIQSTERDREQNPKTQFDCGARCLTFLYILDKHGGKYAKWI